MSVESLSKRYARAVLELATEQNLIDRIGRELSEFSAMWQGNDELQNIFANPKFDAATRKSILLEVIARAGFSPLARNTLLYLADHGRISAIAHVAQSFVQQAEQQTGTGRVEVISAAPLADDYYAQVQQTIERVSKKKTIVERKVDPSLIAGVVVRVGDRVLDGSLRTRLSGLQESLINKA